MDQHEGATVQPHHPPAPRQELCVWAGQEEGHEDDQRSLPFPSQDHGGLWSFCYIVKKVTIVALWHLKVHVVQFSSWKFLFPNLSISHPVIPTVSDLLVLKSIRLHLSPGSRVICCTTYFTYGILRTCVISLKGTYITHFVHLVFHTFLAECRHIQQYCSCINDDCSGDSCWSGERTSGRL